MKKINILEHIYSCSDDAHERLQQFLKDINNHFQSEQEIIRDIELSLIEQFDAIISESGKNELTLIDVNFVIQRMEEAFQIENEPQKTSEITTKQHLYRDFDHRIIGGVCAGIAAYFNLPIWLVRFAFIICFFTTIPVVIPYLIMWYLIPAALTKSEKLNMRGIPVNIHSIVNTNQYTRKQVLHLAKLAAISIGVVASVVLSVVVLVHVI